MNSKSPSDAIPVFIAMATYNGERYLSKQLESILSQTIKPAQIVVSDDRSRDKTAGILEEYSKSGLVKVSVNENNQGVIANFKNSVSLIDRPGYVALSDQDDIWVPEKLQVLWERLSAIDDGQTPAMVYSDLTVVDRNGRVLNPSFWNELGQDGYRHCLQTLLFGNFVTGCTVMMNEKMAEYLKTMPLDVPMHDAWLALIAFSFGKVDVEPKPLVHYRKHENNVAHNEGYRKPSRIQRWVRHIYSIVSGDNEYLGPELEIAEKFYNLFHNRLNSDQKGMFEKFLALRGRSFLVKKLAFRKAFRGYWK